MVEPATFERMTGIRTHYFTEPEVRNLFAGFFEGEVWNRQWILQVRGAAHVRSEIVGAFKKSPEPPTSPNE